MIPQIWWCNIIELITCMLSHNAISRSPGKNTGVRSHFLLQGIFLTQESNLHISWLAGGFFTTEPLGRSNIKKLIAGYSMQVSFSRGRGFFTVLTWEARLFLFCGSLIP